jgi:hypothetical protein
MPSVITTRGHDTVAQDCQVPLSLLPFEPSTRLALDGLWPTVLPGSEPGTWNRSHRIRLGRALCAGPSNPSPSPGAPAVAQSAVRVAGAWLWAAVRGACKASRAG